MAGPRRRTLLVTLVSLAALALATLPAVVAFGTGWMELGWRSGAGETGGVVDRNPIEAWVVLAVATLVWVVLVLFGLVAALDRLGHRYTPPELEPRLTRRERRRRRAALRYGRAQQELTARKEPRQGDRRDDRGE
jgi:hypothetical protein